MKINIITVGKLKEKYMRDGVLEYQKKLESPCNLEIIEVSDEKAPESLSAAQEMLIKEKEGQGILKNLKEGSFVVALAIEGKTMSSQQFKKLIFDIEAKEKKELSFIIGGSLGLSKQVLKRADILLSFSPMTFPHQLMRIILLEQLYRAYK